MQRVDVSRHGTRTIQQAFTVSYRYPVVFTDAVFSPENEVLKDVLGPGCGDGPARFICVLDAGVVRHHPALPALVDVYARRHREFLTLAAPPLVVEGGERIKNDPSAVHAVRSAINEASICRQSYVVAVGAGALLDMAGYAAATAHRGVRLVRVPTTVLAQADSGVGVKNSVNAFGKKNFVGTFATPAAVVNDAEFLATLSDRDWRSGIAEAVKVALLKDAAFFGSIEQDAAALVARDMAAMRRVVYCSAQLHLEHIGRGGDPFEYGSSRPLDLGHWSAHKLEQLSDYRLRHGEAVAIGLALDSSYAHLKGMLDETSARRIIALLRALRLPIFAPELAASLHNRDDPRCVLRGLNEFREHLGGRLTIAMPRQIGKAEDVHEIDETAMLASIALLQSYDRAGD